MEEPSESEASPGKLASGKFAKGNTLSKGNPYAKHVAEIRRELFEAREPGDIAVACRKMLEQAMKGDRASLAEYLDRTVGKTVAMDYEDRIAKLEDIIATLAAGR